MEKKQVIQVIHVGCILSFYIYEYIYFYGSGWNGNCVAHTHTMDLSSVVLVLVDWSGAVRERNMIICYAA